MPIVSRLPHRLGIILPSRHRRGRRLSAFRKHKAGLVHLAEWVAVNADQQAVAILVDSGMELVVEKETS